MSKKKSIPNHIAIIMDGNGRWASERGLDRSKGHLKGYENIKPNVIYAKKIGIKCLTLFAFSTENWNRSPKEVNFIFDLASKVIYEESKFLNKNIVRIIHLGSIDNLPGKMIDRIKESEEMTKDNKDFTLAVAFNYGSRDEILRAVNKIIDSRISSQLSEEDFESFFMTNMLSNPDVVIRTGGEKRLSNFLLWQSAYSELIFFDKFWPDFETHDLDLVIDEYNKRIRNFGS